MAWIIAPLIGFAGAVATGWQFGQSFSYLWGSALAPAVTLAYAKTRHLPTPRAVRLATISLVVTLVTIAVAVGLLLLTLDFSDID